MQEKEMNLGGNCNKGIIFYFIIFFSEVIPKLI